MQCLIVVGDITLTVTHSPWDIEDGVETVVRGGTDHVVQVSDQVSGEIARTKCTELEAMFLISGFCLTDQEETTVVGLQKLWYQTFPQESFNP